MQLTESHVIPFLFALAAFALILGVLAKALALRLLLDCDRAANDSNYAYSRAGSHRSRVRLSGASLVLVARRPATNDFPELARPLPAKPRLRRVR